jgi:hypothetical protein
MHTQILAELVAYIGKGSNAEAIASAVFTRMLADTDPIPITWPAARRWQYHAQSWTAQWQEQRRWEEAWRPPPGRGRREPEQLPLAPVFARFASLGGQRQ